MALPNSNITTTMVGQELGVSTRNVGNLCRSTAINKWSLWKPIASNKIDGLVLSDIIAASCGLSRNVINTITYVRPRGGGDPHNEPYRLGDFRNYNHQAKPPVYPEIVKVTGPGGALIPGPPYQLVESMPYNIHFKLRIGDINPEWIDYRTVREKNTNPEGGYGGVTWVMEQSGAYEYTRDTDEVFSAILEQPNNETEHVQGIIAKSVTDGLRMEYVRYEGSSTGKYKTMNLFIEDDYNDFSYRRQFEFKYLSAGIASIDSLFFGFSKLDVRANVVNDESFPLNLRIRMNYKRLETGNEYTYTGDIQTLPANTSLQWFIGPMVGWSNGFNTFEIRMWMYYVNPVDLSEVEIDYKTETLSVTISDDA